MQTMRAFGRKETRMPHLKGETGRPCQESPLYFFSIPSYLEETTSRREYMPRRPKVNPEDALMKGLSACEKDLPADLLRSMAKESGFVVRERKIDSALFFWNLILGFGASMQRTLASLRKRYCTISAQELAPASFHERFNNRLVGFLKMVLEHLLGTLAKSELPRNILDSFKDVLIFDSTIVRLLDSLDKVFPGTGMPAGVKISAVLSVATDNLHRMAIYAGKRAEVKTLKLGAWIRNHLLLFDLGYFKWGVFDQIERFGGYFVSRLHGNANPTIVADNRSHRGRSINLVGKRIRDCLPRLKRGIIDVTVKASFKRRKYRGKRASVDLFLRLVGVFNEETQEYHLYLTNLPADTYDPERIAELYRGRWCIELLFKELKSRYALDVISTENPEIVRALIYTAMILLVISRKIFVAYRQEMARGGYVVTKARWANFLLEYSGLVLRKMLRMSNIEFTEKTLMNLALLETIDPNPFQERLEDVWNN